ncbi:MAG: carbohydrate ABC transporter permease [Treponema sp.]|jgi:raffinose/stachyose/melibiose transport system permease protein|nr:carbohydrate ABC transporter permease [Treponema sp.]
MKQKFFPLLKYILALIICAIQMVPLYISVTVSFKPQSDTSSYWKLSPRPYWQNYVNAVQSSNLPRAFLNTAVITTLSTLAVVLLSSMAAYPLARNPSPLNKKVKTFILSLMMIPALSLLVPLYVMLIRMQMVSKYSGIVMVHTAFNLPLAIYMISNFINTIPRELDEAALIDGSSVYAIFYRIIVPLLKPVFISIVILTAVPVWNDYQYSLYFLQKPAMQVVTLAIASFFSLTSSDPHVAAAMALMVVIPIAALYMILQKYFIKGIMDGAIK